MKRLIYIFTSVIFTLVIVQIATFGVLSLTTGTPLGDALANSTVYDVKTVTIGTQQQTFYLLNIKQYLKSIQNSVTLNFQAFNIQTPPTFKPKWSDPVKAIKSVFNMLIYAMDWIIYIVNLLLLGPLKLLLAPGMFLTAILGVDFTQIEGLEILTKIYQASIPYIPLV